MLAGRHSIGAGGAGGGVLEFVGSRTYAAGGSGNDMTVPLTTLTGGIASAPRAGDLVVVFVGASKRTTNQTTTPTGFTSINEISAFKSFTFGPGRASNLRASLKVMGSTPDTDFVIPGGTGSTSNALAVSIYVFAKASSATPASANSSAIDSHPQPPSITPTFNGSIILCAGHTHDFSVAVFTSSDFDDFITVISEDSNDGVIGSGRFEWTSGAFAPAKFGSASGESNAASTSISLVIIPA